MKQFFISMLLMVSASSSAAEVATVYKPSMPWLDALSSSPFALVFLFLSIILLHCLPWILGSMLNFFVTCLNVLRG